MQEWTRSGIWAEHDARRRGRQDAALVVALVVALIALSLLVFALEQGAFLEVLFLGPRY